jgi:hypothetical protein
MGTINAESRATSSLDLRAKSTSNADRLGARFLNLERGSGAAAKEIFTALQAGERPARHAIPLAAG